MVCPSCGYALSAFDKECPRCKNLTAQQALPPAPRHVPTPTPNSLAPSPKMSAGKIVGIVIAGFFVFSLFITLVLSILGNRVRNTFSPTPVPPTTFTATDRASLEKILPAQITSEVQKQRGITLACTSVSLVESSENHYTGFADFADGSKVGITVDQGDGGIVWKLDG